MNDVKQKLEAIGDIDDIFQFGQETLFLEKDDPKTLLGIECFKECIKQNYKPFISRYYLAILYNSIGEYNKEYSLYEELICREEIENEQIVFKPILYHLLGKGCCEAKGTTFNPEKGYKYFLMGIKISNCIDNITSVGDCYFNGWYVEKDYSKALEKYREALRTSYEHPNVITNSESSRSVALAKIGKCFLHGYGVEKDANKAYEYLEAAYNMGSYLTNDAKEDFELAKQQIHYNYQ